MGMDQMTEYKLPPAFYWDHTYRDLPEEGRSVLVKETRTYVIVALDDLALDDLYGDAEHYADAGIARDMGMPGLAASARATIKALRKQGYEPKPQPWDSLTR